MNESQKRGILEIRVLAEFFIKVAETHCDNACRQFINQLVISFCYRQAGQ